MSTRIVVAFLAGAVFGLGLVVSRMTQPAVIVGFLDITGDWDPSLAIVMAAALATFYLGYRLISRRSAPVLGGNFDRMPPKHIDRRLVAGSVVFGIGWGLGGFCPGPGLTSFGSSAVPALVFVLAMVCGMTLFRSMESLSTPDSADKPPEACG